jgi:hypothetical protein
MNFYVQHQDSIPVSLGSLRLTDDDIEIDEETALIFYEGKEPLEDWRVANGRFGRDSILLTRRPQQPKLLEIDQGDPPQERDLMLSLSFSQQAIDVFFDVRYAATLEGVEVFLYVDGHTRSIKFDDFVNGHTRIYVPFNLRSEFKLSDNFRSVGLVTAYYSGRYRSVKDRIVVAKVVNGKYILPQHLYHSMAYYALRGKPHIVTGSELVATEARYHPDLITVVGNHELQPAE